MKQEEKSLHIFCMKCKRVVTAKTAKCGIKGKASKCVHKDQHRFQSRIWNKDKKRVTNTRVWPKEYPLEKVIPLHREYKNQCQTEEVKPIVKAVKPLRLEPCILMYLDFLQDVNVPDHSKKNLSKNHILAYRRYLKRFLEIAGNVNVMTVTDHEVGKYHKWILDNGFGGRSYNDHMVCMKAFFDFLIEKEYKLKNPFKAITKKHEPKKVEILTGEELERLFEVMTFENGWAKQGKKNVNRFYPWLKDTVMLALLTGERGDGIYYLKWKHVEENYVKISNLKIERIHGIKEYHYAPITIDLAELLLKLGYGEPEQFVIAPDRENRETLKNITSKAFTHFWRLTGSSKELTFRNLRKTYITRVRSVLGDKIKGLNLHQNDVTQQERYINLQEATKEMKGIRLF